MNVCCRSRHNIEPDSMLDMTVRDTPTEWGSVSSQRCNQTLHYATLRYVPSVFTDLVPAMQYMIRAVIIFLQMQKVADHE